MPTQVKPDWGKSARVAGSLRLLVFEGDRAFLFDLPPDQATWVGRGREADLRLNDPSMAPRHLSLRPLEGGLLEVKSLGGGTRLNDVQLPGESVARPGDQISLGEVRLLVQRVTAPPVRGPAIQPHGVFEERLAEEVERARRHGRPLALLLVKTPAAKGPGRRALAAALATPLELPCAIGDLGPEELELLVPELPPEKAADVVERPPLVLGPRPFLGHATYPADGDEPEVLMEVALERLLSHAQPPPPPDEPLFLDPVMVRLSELLDRVGGADGPVLLQGEPGVGKEMLAGLLHARGVRTTGPFLKLDPLGHGLDGPLSGAAGGTLYVPELLRLTPGAQERLAGVLAREATIPDLRIIAATTAKDLQDEARRGALRADLAVHLSRCVLPVPALRDRPAEIIPLAESFLASVRVRLGKPRVQLGAEARRVLAAYDWPGNLRELRNAMVRAALAAEGEEVRGDALPPAAREDQLTVGVRVEGVDLRTSLKETEREVLLKALSRTRWNVTETARQLGLPRRTVVYRMSRLGLRRPPR